MDLRRSIQKHASVSLALAKKIAVEEADWNLAFSSASITGGSNGQSLDQLMSFLKCESSDHLYSLSSQLLSHVFDDGGPAGGPRVSFANGVWVDQSLSLKHSFKQVVDTDNKAASDEVDFQTKADEVKDQINSWAEKETHGLIKEVLASGSVNSSTRLIFTNALSFKGGWVEKFDKSKTKYYDFHLLSGISVQVPFMTSKKKQYVVRFNGFKVLALPYERGTDERHFTICFFLPDVKDGLTSLIEKIVLESDDWNCYLPSTKWKWVILESHVSKLLSGLKLRVLSRGLG